MRRLGKAELYHHNVILFVTAVSVGTLFTLILWLGEGGVEFVYLIFPLFIGFAAAIYAVLIWFYGFDEKSVKVQIKEYLRSCSWVDSPHIIHDNIRNQIKSTNTYDGYMEIASRLKAVIDAEKLRRAIDPETQQAALDRPLTWRASFLNMIGR
jgi:hypothetical protein